MDVLETRMFLDRKEARIKFEQKDFKITVTCFITEIQINSTLDYIPSVLSQTCMFIISEA